MTPKRRPALRAVALSIASVTLVVVVWALAISIFDVAEYVAPSPSAAIGSMVEKWSDVQPLAWQTLVETTIGFLLGAVIGFVFAVVMSQWSVVRSLLYPSLVAGQAIPIVAIAAPLVIILGFGLLPKVTVVSWIVFFPVTVSVVDGLASVDRDLLNLARVMGGSQRRVFLRIKLPATVTPLFTGLKIGATYAVTGAIIGELVASQGQSLAGYQRAANGFLDTATVWGLTLVMTAIGIGFFLLVAGLERVATPWRTRSVARHWPWDRSRGPEPGTPAQPVSPNDERGQS
jgi:ABC-type nitrate/sulfonate/bicarbonate transport system permease component